MDVLYAAMPGAQPSAIRRLIGSMVRDGALTRASLEGEHCKVWLSADAERRLMRPDQYGFVTLRVVPPRTFVHDKMAALLVSGLGYEFGMHFDREIPSLKGRRKPDGFAWIEPHRALVVEVERLRGRTIHVWDDSLQKSGEIKPGLLNGMVAILRERQKREAGAPIYESLVCLPEGHLKDLEEALAPRVLQLGPASCGWWSVLYDDPDGDLVWHAVRGEARKNLPGIRSIRENFRPLASATPMTTQAPAEPKWKADILAILHSAKAGD